MNPRRLFAASCISLVASAFSFSIRGDIMPALGQTFNLSQQQRGVIGSAAFLGMALSMFCGAPLCDSFGMKRMLGLAFLCHLIGSILTVGAPYIVQSGGFDAYNVLWVAMLLVGCANGFVEIGINPLAATLYPKEKTHRLNVLHAWWPGGLMIGGLLSVGLTALLGLKAEGASASWVQTGWQIKASLVLIPTFIYGALFLGQSFPVTERVASGISTKEMFSQALRPMFLLWAFCMLLTASTELGPQQWQESVLTKTAHLPGTLILVYTSCLMFILRHFAGSIAHKISPIGMLTGSAFLSAIGLYALSFASSPVTAVAFATIFGLGIVFFWPTMLGVTAERFPRGGAFLLGLMGCAGNLAIAAVLPVMGGIYDRESLAALPTEVREKVVVKTEASGVLDRLTAAATPEFLKSPGKIDEVKKKALTDDEKAAVDKAEAVGAQWSFRYVSALPVLVFFIFGAIALSDRARGGYKPEVLKGDELTPEELASDF
jgi:MFS family permease